MQNHVIVELALANKIISSPHCRFALALARLYDRDPDRARYVASSHATVAEQLEAVIPHEQRAGTSPTTLAKMQGLNLYALGGDEPTAAIARDFGLDRPDLARRAEVASAARPLTDDERAAVEELRSRGVYPDQLRAFGIKDPITTLGRAYAAERRAK